MAKKGFNRTDGVGKYFPYEQIRFNTEGLKARNFKQGEPKPRGYGSRDKQQKLPLAAQEMQMLEGIANSFQCSKAEAIRILIHHFSKELKESSVRRVCGRQRIAQQTLANQWLKEKRASGDPFERKTEKLRAAAEAAWDEEWARRQEEDEAREDFLDQLSAQGCARAYADEETGHISWSTVDNLMQTEADINSPYADDTELMLMDPEERRRVYIADVMTMTDCSLEEAQKMYLEEWGGFDELTDL